MSRRQGPPALAFAAVPSHILAIGARPLSPWLKKEKLKISEQSQFCQRYQWPA